MPKIEAWKCPHTGDIFEHKDAYERHLRRVARARRDRKRIEKLREERVETLAAWRAGLSDIRNIEAYVLKHQRMLWDIARSDMTAFCHYAWKKVPANWYPVVEKIQFNLRYSPMVSNSHAAPLTGVRNWGGHVKGAPRGYPGYTGSVEWWTRLPEEGRPKHVDTRVAGTLFSDGHIAIYCGTGGGGGEDPETGLAHYRYSTEIFLDDWQGLKKAHFLDLLAGGKKVVASV